MNFIVDNWPAILAALVAVDAIANKIVKITKSQKDDAVLAAVDKVLSIFKS